jgi:putative oxidoreductase
MKQINNLLKWFEGLCAKLTFVPQLLSRLCVGWLFIDSGWGKLHHLDKVVGFFRDIHIPFPEVQAPFVASMELLCGTLVLIGLLTSFASVTLAIIMAVAVATAKASDIEDVSSLLGIYEFVYILVLLWLASVGPGPLALDCWRRKKK